MGKDATEPLLKQPVNEPFEVYTIAPLSVKFNPFAWFLWTLDFSSWVLTIVGPFGWFARLFRSDKQRGIKVDGAVRYAPTKGALLTGPDSTSRSVHDLMQNACKLYANQRACGTRTYLGAYTPPSAKFPLAKFGETQWTTYSEWGNKTASFGSGLCQLGVKPSPAGLDLHATTGAHTILIFEDTSAAWMTALVGAFGQSVRVATSYSTLGIGAVGEAVNETGAAAIVCNIKDVEKLANHCSSRCPSLKTIIYTTLNTLETEPPKMSTSYKVISVDAVIDMGLKSPTPFTPPAADSLAVIMYTSGSTGKPKGVMIQHSNMVSSIGSCQIKWSEFGMQNGKETYLGYLPAAHIMELLVSLTCFSTGSEIGFADPRTISSKGACRLKPDGSINMKPGYPYPAGAIQEFRPTCFAAVPKIWDILKKGAEDAIAKSGRLKQLLFQIAYSGGYCAFKQRRSSPLFNTVVFNKMKDMLGGRMKFAVTGGGPISAEVHNFTRVAFRVPLIEGYALTETCGGGTVQSFTDTRTGIVGPPVPSTEIKLRSCINAKGEQEILDKTGKPYIEWDTLHYGVPCMGRGEVLIRGPCVSAGYFNQREKTEEDFKDGWFHTGDVGVFLTDGTLMIVDRVKNLIKLKGGEYIAIAAMEKEYATSVYANSINGGVLCYGDGEMDRPIALVQANTLELQKWAKAANIVYGSVDELCTLPAAEQVVLESMVSAAKRSGLGSNEVLCSVALISGTGPSSEEMTTTSPWTPQNNGLTASNKLNRQPILKACSKLVDRLKVKAIR